MTVPPEVEAPVSVRPAERADLLAILRIERASFPQPWPYEAFQRYLGEPGFLVAEAGEEVADGSGETPADDPVEDPVVGYLVGDVIRNHGRPIGHVKDVAVHPEFRGQGVGSALLRQSLFVLSVADRVKLEVRESNDGAKSLYERFGFERLRRVRGYYHDGEDAIVMVRDRD